MKKIARVFPTKTSMSPLDEDVYFGEPELFTPQYDEIHISVSFTWDIEKAEYLKRQWERVGSVQIGGPAIKGESYDGFKPGRYLKRGVVVTSRGCPYRCPWCFINRPIKELKITEGNNIIDNNLLACSRDHIDRVFDMLSTQKQIHFSGGLDSRLITDNVIEKLRGISIKYLFLANDDPSRFKYLKKAVDKLKKYFDREQLRCFVLIGYGSDSLEKAEGRLIETYDLGLLPFAMLYRDTDGSYPEPRMEWKKLQKHWCRPAIYKSKMRERR